ncbi:MAG: hypothetical protein V7K92_06325 [Nostoc sp.]
MLLTFVGVVAVIPVVVTCTVKPVTVVPVATVEIELGLLIKPTRLTTPPVT